MPFGERRQEEAAEDNFLEDRCQDAGNCEKCQHSAGVFIDLGADRDTQSARENVARVDVERANGRMASTVPLPAGTGGW